MKHGDGGTWEKGFDLRALPEVELLEDRTEEDAEVAPVSPATEVEPAGGLAPYRPGPGNDPFGGWIAGHRVEDRPAKRSVERSAERHAIVAPGADPFAGRFIAPTGLPALSPDPASDPFAGWLTGHPSGEGRRLSGARPAQVERHAIVAPGEDPFAGRFATPPTRPEPGIARETPALAEVVSIAEHRSGARRAAAEARPDEDGGAMQRFLAGLSNEELDHAIALFEAQLAERAPDEDHLPLEALDPLSQELSNRAGEVEINLRIEEIEDVIDARLPTAAREDPEWWSNRAGRPDLGHAAAWVRTGWWSYPDLDSGSVRFRRTV